VVPSSCLESVDTSMAVWVAMSPAAWRPDRNARS
jgi:hypothetical protein